MYDSYYGLAGRPFQLTPDPQFYFESDTHRKAMSYLGYGLAQGEGFIVITGEIGAGKTMLVGHLMHTIDRARLTAAQIVTTQLPGDDLLHMVARAFGIDTGGMDKSGTLKSIEYFLHGEARAGRRCLLVIDESQNLPESALEELRMLSNFQLGSHPLLQIFLLGQPEFRQTVQRSPSLEQLRQRIIATHHLEAIQAGEVQPYIQHRLNKVGWNGRPQFSHEACARIYEETGGVPRIINNLCNRLMLMGAIEQSDLIDSAMVDAVVDDMASDNQSARQKRDEPADTVPASAQAPRQADLPAETAQAIQPEPAASETVDDVKRAVGHIAKDETDSAPVKAESLVGDAAIGMSGKSVHSDNVADITRRLNRVAEDQDKSEDTLHNLKEDMGKLAGSSHDREIVSSRALAQAMNRIEELEGRLDHQEKALKHVLSLLVKWIEEDSLKDIFKNRVA